MEDFIRDLASTYGFDRPYVVDNGDVVDIKTLYLPEELRGQGIGTEFLRKLCAEVDRRGVAIGLYPEGDTPERTERMVSWYERHGFRAMPDDSKYHGLHVRFSDPPGTD